MFYLDDTGGKTEKVKVISPAQSIEPNRTKSNSHKNSKQSNSIDFRTLDHVFMV